ncbi:MAG: hypothetical protein NT075_32495 [Chloroflexi bacterium]|nr:hypothetical protein [Chloroflexota bacterium]
MVTTTIPLTEQESLKLQVIARETGQTQDELLHEAVRLLIAKFQPSRQSSPLKTTRNKLLDETESKKAAARQRFERHFGAIKLGYVIDVDNEGIDADLAKEYANELGDA